MTTPTKAPPIERPPKNALRVTSWRDLPSDKSAARFEITRDINAFENKDRWTPKDFAAMTTLSAELRTA